MTVELCCDLYKGMLGYEITKSMHEWEGEEPASLKLLFQESPPTSVCLVNICLQPHFKIAALTVSLELFFKKRFP